MEVIGDYARDGYALVRGLLPVEIANAFLRQLKDDVARAGGALEQLRQGSSLLRREAVEVYGYRYPPMLALLWGLTPAIAALVGRDLLPTYDYLRIYREGDVCRVHSDRHSCEHSLSLTLDYSDGVVWPLEIGRTRRPEPLARVDEDFIDEDHAALEMQPGDAVLYRGVHHRHGRRTPNPNGWSAHLFLHWVDRDGAYADHAFDGNAATTQPVNFTF